MLASPLSPEELGDFIEEGDWEGLLVLDGKPYHVDDLHFCNGCGLAFADYLELETDGFHDPLCSECAEDAREEAEHLRDLESWWRSTR